MFGKTMRLGGKEADMPVRFPWRGAVAAAALVISMMTALANIAHVQAAVPVLPSDTVGSVGGYSGAGDSVRRIAVTGTALPFTRALRVFRKSNGAYGYSAAMIWPSVKAVKKGDLLVATFYLRNVAANRKPLALDVSFQLSDAPYTFALSALAPVDTQSWQKYAIPFRANQDYPAGVSSFQIRYGLSIQTFDAGGLSVLNYGPVADPIPQSISDGFAYYYPGRGVAKAPWRMAALARIKAVRKGDMTVRVVDAGGRAVAGAAVNVVQTRSPFIWGTAASAISLVCKVDPGDSNRPCPTRDQQGDKPVTPADYRKLRKALLQNFNGGSFYNDLKWPDWRNDQRLALDGIA